MKRPGLRNLAATAFVLALAASAMAQTARTESYGGRNVVAGEIIVRFRDASPGQNRALAARDQDIVAAEPVGRTGPVLLRSRGRDVAALLQAYAGRADVQYAEPNYVWRATDLPSDPSFNLQYGLLNTGQTISSQVGLAGADIKAVPAWDITQGSQSIVVGVVDTGVAYSHPDLAANIWSAPTAFSVTISGQTITCAAGTHGFNAITRTCDPLDDHYHGTHVSGIIGAAGNNGLGVSGVNRVASIMGLKFLGSTGSGSTTDAVAAIEFAVQVKKVFGAAANVRVLNNSWGGGGFSQTLLDAINLANASDMLFLAAAGNSASDNDAIPNYPSNYNAPNIVAVAATDNRDALASFSSYGATTVHLGAPGVNVYATYPPDAYQYLSGTSMATPMVSGAAALVLSACAMTTSVLKSTLLAAVDPVAALSGRTSTGGRLNVYRALTNCSGQGTPEFTLASTPGIRNVALDAPATFTLTVAPFNGFTGAVSLATTGLPSGMNAVFTPASVTGGSGSSTLTLTPSGVPEGVYQIAITGTSGSIARTGFVTVTVGPPAVQRINPVSGIAGMTLKAVIQGTGLDSGATAMTFSGTGITATIGAGVPFGSLPVTLAIAPGTPAGRQTFTVTTGTGVSAVFDGFSVVVPQSISPGQTIAGALSTADPIDPLFTGNYADYYRLTLNTTTQVNIDMRSSDFAPRLRLISTTGAVLFSNGTVNPQIAVSLAPGTYFVDASSASAGATGTYGVSINVLPAVTTITPPFAAQGSAVNVTVAGTRFGAPATVDAGSGITVSNVSVSSTTSLTAAFAVSSGATPDVHNVTVATVDGTSNTRAFSIFPSIPQVALGQTLSGALTTTDGLNPYFTSSYADMYRLTLSSITPAIIDLQSSQFDAVLRLVSDSGAVLIFDNNGGGGTNARIFTTLSAGTYYVDVSANVGGTTGAYALSVNVLPAVTAITPIWGSPGSTVAATLAGNRFSNPATVEAGSGITVSNVAVKNPTSLTATLVISAGATLGDRNVTVRTVDGTSNPVVFSVVNQPPPVLTTWRTTGSMSVPRRDHTATLLLDGKVLIVGWTTRMAELYDPVAETFSPIGNTLCDHTQGSTGTRLLDGKVFLIGGSNDQLCAEIYDPITFSFSLVEGLNSSHNFHTATLLPSGKVLLAGGQYVGGIQTHPFAEVYDPATGSFALTGSLNDDRSAHTAVLLPNGKVLVVGGTQTTTPGYGICLKTAELYDPVAGTFTRTGNMASGRCSLYWTDAVLLSTGKVLIAGGSLFTPELFDPETGVFSPAGDMAVSRGVPSARALPNGKVLIAGGYTEIGPIVTSSAEVYDAASGRFSPTSTMGTARLQHTATLLLNGDVLVAGGFDGTTEMRTAERYADAPPNSAITPASGAQGLTVNVSLAGNNFLSPMTIDAGSGITATNISVVSSSLATAALVISAGASQGARSVTVTTPGGSGSATFTVDMAPAFTTQPAIQMVTLGATATFTVAAAGSPAPTYQWQVSTDGGSTWTNLTNVSPYSGATTAMLTVMGAMPSLHRAQYRTVATNSVSTATSIPAMLLVRTVVATVDGDRKTDLAIYRPSSGTWLIKNSTTGYTTSTSYRWGLTGDEPVAADYDGDGQMDAAVYRRATGSWYVLPSTTGGMLTFVLGVGADLPVPGDYDGDGKADPAVFRPSTGVWTILSSRRNYTITTTQWGLPGDIPVPADYDGDGPQTNAVYAAFAQASGCGALSFSGAATTDSYDSTAALVGGNPALANNTGNIGTNGNLNENNSSVINGTLSTPRVGVGNCNNGNVDALSSSGGATVTGGVIHLSQNVTPTTPPVPAMPAQFNSSAITNASGCPAGFGTACHGPAANLILDPGSYNTAIHLTNNARVHLTAGTYNIDSIMLDNSSDLIVDSGPVVVNIIGSNHNPHPFDLNSSIETDPARPFDPTMFVLNYAGTGSLTWGNTSTSVGEINAPNAGISVSSSVFYGSIVGSTVSFSNAAHLHFDRHLATLAPTTFQVGNDMLTSFTWKKY